MSVGQRVLVVDDTDEVRTLIRRVLHTGGFQVETAATLAQARELGPAGFEAVIVDANLGPDLGTDLVKVLTAQDPAAAGRCLVISGGSLCDLPEGVACLAKPFRPGQLLAAVRELTAHAPAPAAAGPPTRTPPRPSAAPPGPSTAAPPGLSTAADHPPAGAQTSPGAWGWRVLALARDLRARERAGLAGYLHDGAVQELTAASLAIYLLRKQIPAAQQQLGELAERLEAAARALRRVTDSGPLADPVPVEPEDAVRERTAWLLGEPPIVKIAPGVALAPAETEAVADVAELVLLPMAGGGPQHAHIEVGAAGGQLEIGTTVTPCQAASSARDGQPAGDLAGVLGGAADVQTGPHWCRVQLTVPRANLAGAAAGRDAVT